MSLREEDRQKNNRPSGALGLAAAAIGVGVGAALFYYFSKRPENPDTEGSTQEWQTQNLSECGLNDHLDEDCYTTISEHSTTDTSILNDTQSSLIFNYSADFDSSDDSSSEESLVNAMSSDEISSSQESVTSNDSSMSIVPISSFNGSDESMDWDFMTSSLDVSSDQRELIQTPTIRNLNNFNSPRRGPISVEQQHLNNLRAEAL